MIHMVEKDDIQIYPVNEIKPNVIEIVDIDVMGSIKKIEQIYSINPINQIDTVDGTDEEMMDLIENY